MTTHSYVQVAPDSTGKKIDCGPNAFSDGTNTLQRQVGQIGDPTALDSIANVTAGGVS